MRREVGALAAAGSSSIDPRRGDPEPGSRPKRSLVALGPGLKRRDNRRPVPVPAGYQKVRTVYRENTASGLTSWSPCVIAVAMSIRSNGSR